MRNNTLDLFKFFACFFVIYIHSIVKDGEYLLVLARIAVPIFFMITGYYYTSIIEKNKEKTYIKKILQLTLKSTILYGFISILYFHNFQLTTEGALKWIFVNLIPFTGGHLWYLYALIYVLIIAKVSRKYIFGKWSLAVIFTLLGANYFLSFDSDSISYRNYLFTGLPYFLLGNYLYTKQDFVKAIRLSKTGFLFWGLILSILLFLEYTIYITLDCFPTRDHYLMLTPLATCLFCYAIQYPNTENENFFSKIGRKYSTDIYIYHLLFILFGDEILWILKHHGYIETVSHNFIYPFVIMTILISTIILIRNTASIFKK